MTSNRRLDIVIGLMAGAIAVLGLSVSLLARNEDAGWFGVVGRQDQFALLAVAVAVLVLAIAKAVCARCR